MRVLVIGGYGATGSRITALLKAAGDVVFTAGRDTARADRVLDLRHLDTATVGAAVSDVEVVINATGAEDPRVAMAFLDHGVGFVDITATTGYVADLERLHSRAPLVLSVGLAPGLTNLLAAAVHRDVPGAVDVALVLGTGEEYGPASVGWSAGLLGARFTDPATATAVLNYTRPQRFRLPGLGNRQLLRVDFSDQHTLTRDLAVPVRTYFGLRSRIATAALGVMTRTPGSATLARRLHLPGDDRWLALARGADGTIRWATGRPQAHATAAIAAFAARIAPRLEPGIHHLHQIATLDDIPTDQAFSIHDIDPGNPPRSAMPVGLRVPPHRDPAGQGGRQP
ncbi:hypothetical protein [Micromonospora arida]